MSDESIPSLIKDLSKSLLDPTLLKRYGTNMHASMSLDYEKYLMNRYNELKLEFLRINKNIEDYCERKRKIEALAEHETYIDRRQIEHVKKLCEYRIEAICLLLKGMTVRINAMLTNICSLLK